MLAKNLVIELDLHGLRTDQAKQKIEEALRRAPSSLYRIHIIHGFNHGHAIRSMIRREYGKGKVPRVLRVEMGDNEGVTDLVLKEYY